MLKTNANIVFKPLIPDTNISENTLILWCIAKNTTNQKVWLKNHVQAWEVHSKVHFVRYIKLILIGTYIYTLQGVFIVFWE